MESEGQPRPLTVLVIEDHAIVRDGCRRICNRRPEFTVVEAASAEEGLSANRRFRPDVIILDIDLSGTSGFDIMPMLLADNPKARVVVFSMYETARFVTKALELGAVGYITKSDEPNILLTAIDKASREIFLSPRVASASAIGERTADAESDGSADRTRTRGLRLDRRWQGVLRDCRTSRHQPEDRRQHGRLDQAETQCDEPAGADQTRGRSESKSLIRAKRLATKKRAVAGALLP